MGCVGWLFDLCMLKQNMFRALEGFLDGVLIFLHLIRGSLVHLSGLTWSAC